MIIPSAQLFALKRKSRNHTKMSWLITTKDCRSETFAVQEN